MNCISCNKKWLSESGHPTFVTQGYICEDCAYSSCKFYLSILGGVNWFKYLVESCLSDSYGLRKRRAIDKKIKLKILKKYNFICVKCGEKEYHKLTIDHIKPYSLGGGEEEDNLQVLCKSCNSIKGSKYEVV